MPERTTAAELIQSARCPTNCSTKSLSIVDHMESTDPMLFCDVFLQNPLILTLNGTKFTLGEVIILYRMYLINLHI